MHLITMVKLIDMLICCKYAKNVKHVLILTLITFNIINDVQQFLPETKRQS